MARHSLGPPSAKGGSCLVSIPRGDPTLSGGRSAQPTLRAAPAAPRGGRLRLLRSFPVPGRELPAERARCGRSRRGAAPSAGEGFVRSSGDLPGSDLGPPRPPRPLQPGSGDPAASRHSGRATAGQRRAWRPGSRRDSGQLTQVSRAGREGWGGVPPGEGVRWGGRG